MWKHYPKYVDDVFDTLLPKLKEKTKRIQFKMYGKTLTSKRSSCLFYFRKQLDFKKYIPGYKQTPKIGIQNTPIEILDVLDKIEKQFSVKMDYALAHIYENYDDYIGWHNDSEALSTDIFSVSFGVPRTFQLRPIKDKKGFETEFVLRTCDMFHMYAGCQKKYKHRIKVMGCKELNSYLSTLGYGVEGRITKVKLGKVLEKEKVDLSRINLTFRQFEE